MKPVDVWLCTDYTRAALGGTGTAKCGGNYAASLLPQAQGAEHGCAQVAYLDAEERTLDRRDGLEQPVLRLRLGRPDRGRHPHADAAASWPASPATRCCVLAKELGCEVTERRISGQGVARRRRRRPDHARSSAAAPPP